MSKAHLLRKAAEVVGKFLAEANDQQIVRASARIGTDIVSRGAKSVVNTVRDNPVTAALLLYEAGPAAKELLEELVKDDPRVAEVYDVLRASEVDDIEEGDTLLDIAKFEDEFRDLASSIATCGSLSRFLAFRRGLEVSDQVLTLFLQTRNMAGSIR